MAYDYFLMYHSGGARIWDPNTGREESSIGFSSSVTISEFSSDGRFFVGGGNVWEIVGTEFVYRGLTVGVSSMSISPDSSTLAVALSTAPRVRFYNLSTQEQIAATINTFSVAPQRIHFHPSGNFLSVTYGTSTAGQSWQVFEQTDTHVWQSISLPTIPAGWNYDTRFSPDGGRLAVGGSSTSRMKVFSFPDFNELVSSVSAGSRVRGIDWSPDGRYLAYVSDGSSSNVHNPIVLDSWDSYTPVPGLIRSAFGFTTSCQWCKFSPDGKFLAVVFGDDDIPTVVIYETENWQVVYARPAANNTKAYAPSWSNSYALKTHSGTILDSNGQPASRVVKFFRRDSEELLASRQSGTDGKYHVSALVEGDVSDILRVVERSDNEIGVQNDIVDRVYF